jgi:hypothetical protein
VKSVQMQLQHQLCEWFWGMVRIRRLRTALGERD